MFFERDVATQVFNDIKKKENRSYILATAYFHNHSSLTNNQFIIVTVKWKKKIKDLLHEEDIGYVVNAGNIIFIVDNERKEAFMEAASKVEATQDKKVAVASELIELNEEEAAYFFKYGV